MQIKIYQPCHIHHLGQRDNQEDSIYPSAGQASPNNRLFLVCDGMGGHENGEVASQTVCKAFEDYFATYADYGQVIEDNVLFGALAYAYQLLDAADKGGLKKMGTTLTLVCFHKGGVTMAHAGDSRIYHIRPGEASPLYKSRDHSVVYDLYMSGEISFEEMKTNKMKNYITRALMPGEDSRVELSIAHTTDVLPGDYFYLCSDGMLEIMEDEELVSILSSNEPDESKTARLLDATQSNKDNHSAYLLHVAEVNAEAGDKNLLHDEDTSTWNAMHIKPYRKEEEAAPEVTKPAVSEQVPPIPAPQVQPLPPQRPAPVPPMVGTPPRQPYALAPPATRKFPVWIAVALAVAACLLGAAAVFFLKKGKDKPEQTPQENPTTITAPEPLEEDLNTEETVPFEDAHPNMAPSRPNTPPATSVQPTPAPRQVQQPNKPTQSAQTPSPTPTRQETQSSTPAPSSSGQGNSLGESQRITSSQVASQFNGGKTNGGGKPESNTPADNQSTEKK